MGHGALLPQHGQGFDKVIDVGIRVQRPGRKAQTLGPFWHRRIVDRLYLNAPFAHQIIRQHLTFDRVFDHHWDDVAGVVQMRNALGVQPVAQTCDLAALSGAFHRAGFQMGD